MRPTTLTALMRNVRYTCMANSQVIIWGPPGIGKSRSLDALARLTNRRLVTVIGSYVDPTTMGFPVLDPNSHTTDSDGRRRPVVDTAPQKLFTDLNDNPRKWILFLDELTSVPATVIAAWLRLVNEGVAGDYRLDMRKGWIICAANSADQAANGSPLPDPMISRLAHMHYPVTESSALEWADGSFVNYWNAPELGWPVDARPDDLENGARVEDDHIIRARSMFSDFVRRRPTVWHPAIEGSTFTYGSGEEGWPCARSLDRASRSLAIALAEGRAPVTCIDIVASEIGSAAATEFNTYVSTADIPDPEAVLADPHNWKFSGRVDLDYAVMLAVAAAVTTRPTPDRVVAGFTVCTRSTTNRSGSPSKEAAMSAIKKLGKLLTKGSDGMKAITKGMSQAETETFVKTIATATAPFAQYINMARGG